MNETVINTRLLADNQNTINSTEIYSEVNSYYNKSNITTIEMEQDLTARNVIIITSYSLIIIISLCGNLLVCKIAFNNGNKKMRNTTNLLIASLAISDIIMTSFNVPFNVARLLLQNWPFGSFLCFFVPFIQTSCVYVSTFTMTFIALHRFFSLTKRSNSNMNCHTSNYRVLIAVTIIWLLAFILSLPHSIFNEIKEVQFDVGVVSRCRVTYPKINIDFRLFLSIEVFLTQYLVPLLTTTHLYVRIGRIISAQGRVLTTANNERRRAQVEAKRRRILMLALVVIVFAVCCYNPFIYCWRDETFREGAKKLLFFHTIRTKRNTNNNISGQQNSIKLRFNDSMRQMTRIEIPDKDLNYYNSNNSVTSDL